MRKKQPQATKAPQAKFGGTFPQALYERLTAEAARENRSIVGQLRHILEGHFASQDASRNVA
ncbi:MAG TPA: hypothetical protein VKC57_07055 [Ktedonobacterales bacterium]|nr:hypothetical protein [Ktedonobacterales bacterium]